MKDNKRLAVGGALFNSPTGYLILHIQDFDGGPFGLHPKVTDEGTLVLVDPQRPAGYGLELKGDPEALKRLGAALIKLGRDQTPTDDDPDAGE